MHALARARSWFFLVQTGRTEPLRTLTPPPGEAPGPFVIGRQPSSDLWLDDPTVSKHHADLRRTDEGWMLVDVGSSNGTRVNGWRIHDALLREGDLVELGAVSLRFQER